MSDQRLTQSPEKTKQRIAHCESRPVCAPSYYGGLYPIFQLHRTIGNRRVEQLIQAKRLTPRGTILDLQRKLTVGAANDQYKQEADRVASQVLSMPDVVATNSVQRAIAPEEDKDQMLQSKPVVASLTPVVQRQMGNDNEEAKDKPIQPQSADSLAGSVEAGDHVETQINLSKGSGSPLLNSVRAYMEPRFGVDFSHVRVHTGSDAIQMNQSVGAQAFTHGSDIYFGAGSSPANLDLTAHELAHVVQQQGGLDFGQPVLQRRTVREEYATAASEEGPICDVRLVITGAPESDTEDLMEFIDAAERGIRRACGTLPRLSSRAIHVTMPHRRGMEYSDVSGQAYIAARISVLGRSADPVYIAEQERIAAERARVARLDSDYRHAVRTGDWQRAAEYLSGFNDADIASRLSELSLTQLGELRHGAVTNPRLGGGARLAAAIDRVNSDARRVASLIAGYESSLATGDWASAAEHLNGFSDTDIRERLTRLDRFELSSLRDGAIRNPRLGRGTRLVGLIDGFTAPDLLLGVGAACFDGAIITVTKNRATHSCAAFTGSVGDPTPNGRFCVRMQGVAQIGGGITGRLLQDRSVWYLLEPQFRTSRSRMQLHPGTMSAGCITVNDRACFDQLAAVLNLPGMDTGRGYDGYPPGNAEGVINPESNVGCLAWLDVTSTRGGCGT